MRLQIYLLPALVVLMLLTGARQAAANEFHLGVVVSSLNGVLVVANEDGGVERSFEIATDTKLTMNGMPCKLEDITTGDLVKVTTETKDGKTVVVEVDAKSGKEKQD